MRRLVKEFSQKAWLSCLMFGAALALGQNSHALVIPNYSSGDIINYEQNTKFSDRHGHDIYNLIYIQSYASLPHDTTFHEAWRTSLTTVPSDAEFGDAGVDWSYVDFILDPRDDPDPDPRLIYDHKLEDGWHYRYFLRAGCDNVSPWQYSSSSDSDAYFNMWTCTNAPRLYSAHQNNAGNGIIVNWGFNSNIVDSTSPFYDSNNDSHFIVYRGEVTVNGYEDIDPARPEADQDDTITNVISWNVSDISQRSLTDTSNLSAGKKYVYAMQAYHYAASKNGLMSNNIYVDYTGTANYGAPSSLYASGYFLSGVPKIFSLCGGGTGATYGKMFKNEDYFYEVDNFSFWCSFGIQLNFNAGNDARFYYLREESYDSLYTYMGESEIAEALTPMNPPTNLVRNGGSSIVGVSWSHYTFRADPCGGENKDPFLCYDISVTNNSTSVETIYYQPENTVIVKAENPDYVWGAFQVADVSPNTTYTVKVRAVIRDIDLRSAWSSPFQVVVD